MKWNYLNFNIRDCFCLRCKKNVCEKKYLGIRTRRCRIRSSRSDPQKVIECWSAPSEWIIRWHESIINETIHKNSLLDDSTKFRTFLCQVPIIIITDNDAIYLSCQSKYITIIIAHHALSTHQSVHTIKYFKAS